MGVARRLWNNLRGGRHTDEIDDELAFHLDMRIEQLVATGMSPDEARRAALRQFGNPTLTGERMRDVDVIGWLDRFQQDLRYAVRGLRSSPSTAVVLLVSLALGIGANAAMFTLLYSLLLRPLPVRDPAGLQSVSLGNFSSYGWVERADTMSHPIWERLRHDQRSFAELFAYSPATLDIRHGGEVRLVSAAYASATMWTTLGVRPVLGRVLTSGDEVRGARSAVAVIGEALWEREYLRDPQVIGRSIALSGRPVTIVGVAPRRFFGMYVGTRADVFLPIEAAAWLEAPDDPLANGQRWWLNVVGRLRPGVGVEFARRELAALSPLIMAQTVPPDLPADRVPQYRRQFFAVDSVSTGFSDLRGSLSQPMIASATLLSVLLLLACINVATLQLGRGMARQREYAVRVALGASRGRLGRQVFLESLLAACTGAAFGVLLSTPITRGVLALYATALSSVDLELRSDGPVLLFTAGLSILTAVLFGLAPVLQAMRTDPQSALRSARGATPAQPVRQWLLGGQVALALVLTVGAMLFVATLRNLSTQQTGFRDAAHLLLVRLDIQRTTMPKVERGPFYLRLLDRLAAVTGVESAAGSYVTPLDGSTWQTDLTVTDGARTRAGHAHVHAVSADFLRTYGTPLLEGRGITRRDTAGAPQIALVNRAFVRTVLANGRIAGTRVRCGVGESMTIDAEIVGVVADAKYRDLRSDAPATLYVAMAQDPTPPPGLAIALRTRGPVSEVIPAVRAAMREYPDAAYIAQPFQTLMSDSVVNERVVAAIAGLFGALALLLAGVGVYGLAAYAVVQRRTEIGIRLALGASAGRVLRVLFRHTGYAVAAGIAVGAVVAAWSAQLASAMFFDVAAGSVWVYAASGGAVLAAATAAVAGPALRASHVDPAETLRAE